MSGPASWRDELGTRLRNSALGRWVAYDHSLVVYRLLRAGAPPMPDRDPRVHRDDWAQLRLFESEQRWLPRRAFLRSCEQRLADGEHVYTIAEGRRLLAYAWLVPRQERSWLPAVRQELRYPGHAAVMYNAYTSPDARGRGLNTVLARARIADAFEAFGADAVYTAVSTENSFAERAKRSVGMRPWLGLSCHVRLGRTRVSRQELDGERFEAVPSAAPA